MIVIVYLVMDILLWKCLVVVYYFKKFLMSDDGSFIKIDFF